MTNDCKTCPVSTGTHKPAEALHQIAEPATVQAAPSEVMGALRALHDSVELAIQRGALSERALEIIIMQPATDVLMRAAAQQGVQQDALKQGVDRAHYILSTLGYHRDGDFFVNVNRVGAEAIHVSTIAAIANAAFATHPTQQGLDAQRWQIVHDHISGEYIAGRACFVVHVQPMSGSNIMRGSVAQHFTKAVDDRAKQIKIAHQAWLAAQAKQGEQANG